MSIIKSSLINLKGHKLRVFVTLLWIIMGITSSILVSSIGNGLKKEVTDSVSRVNPNKTRIYFESSDSNMANMETFLNPFKLEDIDELSFIEGVERIGASKDDFSMGSMYYSDAYFDKKTTYVDIKEFNGDDKIVPVFGRSFSYDDDNRKVILCHYPIFCYNGQFRRNKDGDPKTWMLHGHTHLTPDQQLVEQFKDITRKTPRPSRSTDSPEPAPIQMINCFCMLSDYVPLTLDEWIELENSGKIRRSLQNNWRYDNSEKICQKK